MLTRGFIVGFPRSGTTLLQSMIAAHPKVHSFPETHFWAILTPTHRLWRSLGLPSMAAFDVFQAICQQTGLPRRKRSWPLPAAFNRRVFARQFVGLLDHWALAKDCTHWIEKTPRHLHSIPQIQKDVSNVRFVHILRNGHDAVASLYDATRRYPEEWGGHRSVERCVSRWCSDVERSLNLMETKGHHFVRYENLVSDPQEVIDGCCDFLGLNFYPSQLENFGSQDTELIRPEEHWKREVESNVIRRSGRNKFLEVFSRKQQEYVLESTQALQKKMDRTLSNMERFEPRV